MTRDSRRPGTELLHVRCRSCGTVFASPLQVDRATLVSLAPEVNATCPDCGLRAVYSKQDVWYELVVERESGP